MRTALRLYIEAVAKLKMRNFSTIKLMCYDTKNRNNGLFLQPLYMSALVYKTEVI